MSNKSINAILNPPPAHSVGDGFYVHNFFPSGHRIKMSPFFLLDYNAKTELAPSDVPRGVGVHPHRGFETVTLVYHGAVAHHDSAGNAGVIYAGDVQWMTAASGVLHKEYHESNFSKQGGFFQVVQLWVNLPAKYKMTAPKYQSLSASNIPKVELPNGASVSVVAGNFQQTQGGASTFSPLELYNIKLLKGNEIQLPSPSHYHTAILVLEGALLINGEERINTNQMAYFNQDGETINLSATAESLILYLSGEPINEPIAQYGPFLMNNAQEIQQAIEDYNTGKFGYLED